MDKHFYRAMGECNKTDIYVCQTCGHHFPYNTALIRGTQYLNDQEDWDYGYETEVCPHCKSAAIRPK